MKPQDAIIQTERLTLRKWKEEDLELFAEMNKDLKVMEYFPAVLTQEQSDEMAICLSKQIEQRGWGLWAVSVISEAEFIGFIGFNPVSFDAHFTPVIEIGWRLAYPFWKKGYATEGAKAALEYGFNTLNLEEIVSFTAVQNIRSRAVMERIGMDHDPKDDFGHPKLPKGHKLSRHVLYRLKFKQWQKQQGTP